MSAQASSNQPNPSYAKSLLASSPPLLNPPGVTSTITALALQPHPEGGFFVETDRDRRLVPNPFMDESPNNNADEANSHADATSAANGHGEPNASLLPPEEHKYLEARKPSTDLTRHASTTIHYFLSPSSPLGRFHRNRARTVHTLHWGRGAYVVLHPPENQEDNGHGAAPEAGSEKSNVARREGEGWRMETFVVGKDIVKGEKVQWIVEGGRYKASYLLPDTGGVDEYWNGEDGSKNGLLISETVVPGFEFSDHDFLTAEKFQEILGKEGVQELGWLLGQEEGRKLKS